MIPHCSASHLDGLRKLIASTVIAASLLGLLFLLPQIAAGQSDVSPNSPEAPGSIAGVVSAETGAPQPDIIVTLYRQGTDLFWRAIQTLTTNQAGVYKFGLLGAGIYRIGFNDPNYTFASSYYSGAATVEAATDIVVTGNNVTDVNAILRPGGGITGIVTTVAGITITERTVQLMKEISVVGGPIPTYTYWSVIRTAPLPASRSVYSFTGLAPDLYRICAFGGTNFFTYLYECYDNVANVANGTDISVTYAITRSDINIVLGDGADYGQITGTVTSPTGEPLPEIWVSIQTNGGSGWLPGYSTQTNADGVYRVSSLISDTYVVRFSDPKGQYAFEYYQDVPLPEQATELKVPPATRLENVNAALAPAAHITGTITVIGQTAAPSPYVSIYVNVNNQWQQVGSAATDPQTGRYDAGGLPPGLYRICAQSSSFSSGFYSGCYGGATVEEAADIPLATGASQADINFDLTGGPTYEGEIGGVVTAEGAPRPGLKVSLYSYFSCCGLIQPLVYAYTDADGRYSIAGLAEGLYTVEFSDPDGTYATTYYRERPTPSTSERIFLSDATIISDVNAALGRAGAIRGKVQRNTGAPVSDLSVVVYWRYEQGYNEQLPISTLTDANGEYTVKGLLPGVYRVCFSAANQPFSGECYDAAAFTEAARDVIVQADQTTSGIDLIWGPDYASYFPFVSQFNFTCADVSELPLAECEALVAIGRSSNQPAFLATIWFGSNTPCQWTYVTCADGHVTQLLAAGFELTSLPPQLGDLANLEELSLSNNYSLAALPPEIGKLTKLRRLNLSYTQLRTLPPEIGNLVNLEELNLSATWLASLPPAVSGLASLQTLDLSYNQSFTGLPPEVGNLGNLQVLRLDYTPLTSLPVEIGNLAQLRELNLPGTMLKSLPSTLGNLASLQLLDLSYNGLTEAPAVASSLPNLQRLDLSGNFLTAVPPALSALQNLQWLDLSLNHITNVAPELGNLAMLDVLSLSNNQLITIPATLGNLANLRELYLFTNQLTTVPPELGKLTKLEWLDLSQNRLESLPPELGNLTNLEFLSLAINRLPELPPELFKLTRLKELYLYLNQLASLPPEIGKLTNLEGLSLFNNRLTTAPPELGKLSNLRSLDLSFNQLTTIPAELGNLAQLQGLYLSDNPQLAGAIPATFLNLRLYTFGFFNTNLCTPNTAEFQTWLTQIANLYGPIIYCNG